jgi:hypothetical protein
MIANSHTINYSINIFHIFSGRSRSLENISLLLSLRNSIIGLRSKQENDGEIRIYYKAVAKTVGLKQMSMENV